MRRLLLLLIASLVVAPCLAAFAPRARAEDAPDDSTAAGKAYREAWWAETAGGNLTQAVELYGKAVDAEGPASVKARALYRKAVVLQRIGKTEEAIRTLERLAKDHPGEAGIQTDARARLAEWTAVDLKTSFAEWYQRYQYSPEFQAKIVDLVLKLGSSDPGANGSASNEILTIGAPAIPALRQHVASPNASLRNRVVVALLQLGDVPPLESLRVTAQWRNDAACWEGLRSASAEERARLRSEAKADEPWDQGLLAALEGARPLLTWANTPDAQRVAAQFLSMGSSWYREASTPKELFPLLVTLAEDKTLEERARLSAAWWLVAVHGVDAVLAETWAGGDDAVLRTQGLNVLLDPSGGREAWLALRRLLKVAPKWANDESKSRLIAGLLAGVDAMPAGAELDSLADDLLSAGPTISDFFRSGLPLAPAALDVVARMIDRARDQLSATQLFGVWSRRGGASATTLDRLAGWARSAPWDDLRQMATQVLTSTTGGGEQRALAMLTEADLPAAARYRVFDYLMRVKSPANLLRDPSSRRTLLATLRRRETEGPELEQRSFVGRFLEMMSRASLEDRIAMAEEWLADPVTYPRNLLRDEYASWSVPTNVEAAWRAAMTSLRLAWTNAWASWTPAQRDAALEGLYAMLPSKDVKAKAFLQEAARDRANGISRVSRARLLEYVEQLSLDDLRLAFDFGTPEGADAAIEFISDLDNLPTPLPVEWFEAFKAGLRPDGSEKIARALLKLYEADARPRVFLPLIEALLAHDDAHVGETAVDMLAGRETSADLPLWLRALAAPSASVRATAATGLGRIAHPDATKALVKALDDPNSSVRDAAIASLEAIQKIEELKKTWREKVR